MIRTLVAAAMAAAVISPVAASAAHLKQRTHQFRHHARMWQAPVSMQGYGDYGRMQNQTARPPWAGPAECYEDLGYGRFESCDRGR